MASQMMLLEDFFNKKTQEFNNFYSQINAKSLRPQSSASSLFSSSVYQNASTERSPYSMNANQNSGYYRVSSQRTLGEEGVIDENLRRIARNPMQMKQKEGLPPGDYNEKLNESFSNRSQNRSRKKYIHDNRNKMITN